MLLPTAIREGKSPTSPRQETPDQHRMPLHYAAARGGRDGTDGTRGLEEVLYRWVSMNGGTPKWIPYSGKSS